MEVVEAVETLAVVQLRTPTRPRAETSLLRMASWELCDSWLITYKGFFFPARQNVRCEEKKNCNFQCQSFVDSSTELPHEVPVVCCM